VLLVYKVYQMMGSKIGINYFESQKKPEAEIQLS
jgi:hypothetical protein